MNSTLKKNLRIIYKIINFPLVAIRALFLDERHMIQFYLDRHIIKALGLYRFKDPETKKVALMIDEVAAEVVGDSHETYSGATAAEVASGFGACIDQLAPQKLITYLEIGSAKGKSMGFIGSYCKNKKIEFRAVSVDPYFEEAYIEGADQPDSYLGKRKTYVAPIDSRSRQEAIALWDKLSLDVEQIRMTSEEGLNELITQRRMFNLIYIDGLHDGLTPVMDFLHSLRLISDQGIIILDDRHWANVHYLRKICDNTPSMNKIYENWKISAYIVTKAK